MLALTRDGRAFGHRLHTRSSAVAPGFMWCKFDEELDGELQVIWAATLLAGDRQLRLAAIRPSFPVRAFEAPGALGCDCPAGVRRRSDAAAGWEYAEASGRAVAIRRLLGFDGQTASAPFQDQSNINLAYAYSEQPLIFEAQPGVAPRCLASVSLVRPAAFEPEHELDGFSVTAGPASLMRTALPDGTLACVALGDVLPASMTLAGRELRGEALRFARARADWSWFCGLGVTSVEGAATCCAPGTLQLARMPGGEARISTDVGLSLAEAWLGGPMRHAFVQALDGSWIEVTGDCRAGELPAALVRNWSATNNRSLVEFKVLR